MVKRPDTSDLDAMMGNHEPGDESEQRSVKHRAVDFPKPDMTNPAQFRMAARHITNVYASADEPTRQAGRIWYPKVHEAVTKAVRGMGLGGTQESAHRTGSGLVAALSPNMDFERTNLPAFHDITKLKPEDWDAIHKSAAQPYGSQRTPEAARAVRGLSISTAPDSGLVKAHRLLQGEDVDTVMPRQTAPKTNSFASNIHSLTDSPHVTIDGRAHDIANNEMWPWMYSGRGISSAALPSATKRLKSGAPAASFGKKTRYEHFEDAYRSAADEAGEAPHEMQAITWMRGKQIETSFPTRSGAPRVNGVTRKRQPYVQD